MPVKILVVDDDDNICELLRLYLGYEGYGLCFAGDGSRALDLFRKEKPDLVILDIMLPLISGWEVCRLIRRESNVPIIMVTARDATEDKLSGFDAGADDYIVKPFDPKEAVARVRALLRRSGEGGERAPAGVIKAGGVAVNLSTYQVTVGGNPVELKGKEIQLLNFLISNPNIVFTREQLLEKVWGYDYHGETRTVDVHIKRLRAKLAVPGCSLKIRTLWGIGYKLEVR
jgi:DNA-binding response OmpR family regulator